MGKDLMPKRMLKLGWIEVDTSRRNKASGYVGKILLNLDLATKIHFPDGKPGVAVVHFGERNETLDEDNYSRVVAAIVAASI